MTVYFVGGFPASGKSEVARIIHEKTGLPIITFDNSNYNAQILKLQSCRNACILDMTFEKFTNIRKFQNATLGEKVYILVTSDRIKAFQRNRSRARVIEHGIMLSYWMGLPHPFHNLEHRFIIDNYGTLDDLRNEVLKIL
jgi:hypothetical protein